MARIWRPNRSAHGFARDELRARPRHQGRGKLGRVDAIVTAQLGTWDWVSATGGALTGRQKLQLVPGLLRTFRDFVGDRLRLALGRRRLLAYDLDELWPVAPDSAFCRRSEEEARDLQSDPVMNHAYRTWIFGNALAVIDEARIDPEVFYAGSLLHDAGLEHIRPGQCFTHRSAEAAQGVALEVGFDSRRTREVMDGIVNHITPGLNAGSQPVSYYLQVGAMADLLGVRTWELPPELRSRAAQQFPRLKAHAQLSQKWREESRAVPKGRAHYAHLWGGFGHLVRLLPVART